MIMQRMDIFFPQLRFGWHVCRLNDRLRAAICKSKLIRFHQVYEPILK